VGSVCLLAAVVGPAAVVGVCGILVFIPIENRVNKWSKALRKGSLKLSDTRMAHVYDLLDGIRTVKLANLTGALESRITALRDAELKQDALVTSLNVFNRALMSSAPALVAVITFTLYFFLERAGSDSSAWWSVPPLTADRAFTAIALLGQLSHPFKVMPKAIQLLADANVSVGRIQGMVDETEASCAGSDEHPEILEGAPKVELENFSVSRSPVGDSFSLRNISAHFERGLNMVIGTNASGKSTLLMGIMSELKIITGSVRLKPSETGVAFASSDATWVINATAKENIVLGSRSSLVDEMRYQEAVHACALDRDFSEWVDGDQTMIGEKGTRPLFVAHAVVLMPVFNRDHVIGRTTSSYLYR
jgi:ABC-type multidrug transport system fused ATPase/permease subunit